jgi:uncharacterized protein YecE (DUF72 family)
MNKARWHIGCSGFHYRDWKGIFYPPDIPQKKWFEYYSSKFDTLELNVTFYRFPQLKFLQTWYENSPDAFSFAVKVPRLITHFKQLKDCQRLLGDFYNSIREGLKDKLGAVLFQLPPQWYYTEERLELLVNNMTKGFTNVVEFRHDSWWNKKVYQRLKKESLVFCGISHPSLPDDVIITGKTAYYRFHGIPRLYFSAYKSDMLKRIADQLACAKNVNNMFIYFNNTATVGAIKNAVWFKNYLKKYEIRNLKPEV